MLDPARYLDAARIATRTLRGAPAIALEEAEGAALEALVRAKPDRFAQAVAIARNAAIDELRDWTGWSRSQRRRTIEYTSDAELALSLVSDGTSDTRSLDWIDEAVQASERLSDTQRAVIVRRAQGFSLTDIARELDMTVSNVSRHYKNSLHFFRRLADQ